MAVGPSEMPEASGSFCSGRCPRRRGGAGPGPPPPGGARPGRGGSREGGLVHPRGHLSVVTSAESPLGTGSGHTPARARRRGGRGAGRATVGRGPRRGQAMGHKAVWALEGRGRGTEAFEPRAQRPRVPPAARGPGARGHLAPRFWSGARGGGGRQVVLPLERALLPPRLLGRLAWCAEGRRGEGCPLPFLGPSVSPASASRACVKGRDPLCGEMGPRAPCREPHVADSPPRPDRKRTQAGVRGRHC